MPFLVYYYGVYPAAYGSFRRKSFSGIYGACFMIFRKIKLLVKYALDCDLIKKGDETFCINRILEILSLDEFEDCDVSNENESLEEILSSILDYAAQKGLIENTVTCRDLFDTKLMSVFVPRPSYVTEKFYSLFKESPEKATDYYYKLSRDSDYIRRYRVCRDLKWKSESEYGVLDITVNLSKPEKTPEEIAAAKLAAQSGYPKCLLCPENEGYAGRMNHPARQNHRIIPITIDGADWGFQYSPYVYYNEHCIVFNKKHIPMKIDKSAFKKLLDFTELFPHYFIGSNADLPIVGGSILSHEHFQGGRYEFAMAKAPIETELSFNGFEDVTCGIVKWPMSVIRIRGKEKERLVLLADKILTAWRRYSDEKCFIFAETDGEPHNTVTPIARRRGEDFEMDLVLRQSFRPPSDKNNRRYVFRQRRNFQEFHEHRKLSSFEPSTKREKRTFLRQAKPRPERKASFRGFFCKDSFRPLRSEESDKDLSTHERKAKNPSPFPLLPEENRTEVFPPAFLQRMKTTEKFRFRKLRPQTV